MRRLVLLVVLAQLAMATSLSGADPLTAATVGTEVTVEGRLELAGENYYLDPRFVLVDDVQRIPVTAWAPLEIPPPMPDAPRSPSRPQTMQQYVGRRLEVTGIHRSGSPDPQAPLQADDHYLEVLSVVDVLTGATVFQANAGTLPADTTIPSTTLSNAAPVLAAAAPVPAELPGPSPSAQVTSPPATAESGPSPVPAAAAPVSSGSSEQAPSPQPAATPSSAATEPSPAPAPAAPVDTSTSSAPEPAPVMAPAAPDSPPSSPEMQQPDGA